MRVLFRGVTRRYTELRPGYASAFNRFHLELPWYFARDGGNQVTVETVDGFESVERFDGGGCLELASMDAVSHAAVGDEFDVAVHWRRWDDAAFVAGAANLLLSQDHSYSSEQVEAVRRAHGARRLRGVLCFPEWHARQLELELGPNVRLLPGVTLGVDTDVYHPLEKERFSMLWASDPGRGLAGAVQLAAELWRRDRRYRLDVAWPDYVRERPSISHPAVRVLGCLENGPDLWTAFNRAAFLPYTSTFAEPSSRAHRQAQAAGCVVLYPPGMGTPSDLIRDGVDGFVRPVKGWADIIHGMDAMQSTAVSIVARARALSESWAVQAGRFNALCKELLDG